MAPGGSHRGGGPPARTRARRKRVAASAYPTERQRSPAMTPGSKAQWSSITVTAPAGDEPLPCGLVAASGGGGAGGGAGAGLLGDALAPGDLVERLTGVGGEEAHEGAPHTEGEDEADDKEGGEEAAVLLEVHVEGGDHHELGGREHEQRDEGAPRQSHVPEDGEEGLLGDEHLGDGDDEQDDEDEDVEARGG